jgi:tetratricopeptide (TPR) repeat protein
MAKSKSTSRDTTSNVEADTNGPVVIEIDDALVSIGKNEIRFQVDRDVAALLVRADELLADEHYEPAEVVLTKALVLDPNSYAALSRRGLLLSELGRHDEALVDLTKALELNQKEAAIWASRAVAYYESGESEKALEDLQRAIELEGGSSLSAQAYYHKTRGVILADLARHTEALAEYEHAIQLDPEIPELSDGYFEKGKLELKLGKYEDAVESLSKDVNAGEPSWATYWNRHEALVQLGKLREAVADLASAIELNPEEELLHTRRSELLGRLGDRAP